jgi:hypothetical protein
MDRQPPSPEDQPRPRVRRPAGVQLRISLPDIEQPGPVMEPAPHSPENEPRRRSRRPNDVFQLRISLLVIEPPIWRRILVPPDLPLPRLHRVIQISMGWTDTHLYQFKVGKVWYGEPGDEYETGLVDHRRIPLNQILPKGGATCIYEYDLGDGWEHLIELEDVVPAESVTSPLPRCLAGERACPVEDIGGTHGYAELLDALRDPSHEEHEDYLDWFGEDFDPEAFDLDGVNRRLSRFAVRPHRPGR